MSTSNILSQLGSPGVSTGFKNRIINGAMVIDQRNAGASVNPTTTYVTDRFLVNLDTSTTRTAQQSPAAPAGFINSLYLNNTTGANAGAAEQNLIQQSIEGLNVADLGWGTVNAKTITVSFWVYSSLTGTYAVALSNSAANRCYVATYTIASANTWQYVTLTIAGDTTGTWLTTNGIGIRFRFDLGSGSNYQITGNTWGSSFGNTVSGRANWIGTSGATFYITGVQLEVGTTATNFDYRSYGTELALCQRYYQSSFPIGTAPANNVSGYQASTLGVYSNTSSQGLAGFLVCDMRATPTLTSYNSTVHTSAGKWGYYDMSSAWQVPSSSSLNIDTATARAIRINMGLLTSFTNGSTVLGSGAWAASAEL